MYVPKGTLTDWLRGANGIHIPRTTVRLQLRWYSWLFGCSVMRGYCLWIRLGPLEISRLLERHDLESDE